MDLHFPDIHGLVMFWSDNLFILESELDAETNN